MDRPSLPAGLAGTGRPGNRAAVVDAQLRERRGRLEAEFFAICDLVQEAIDGAYYVKFGFPDIDAYLRDAIGLSWRSIRKRLAPLEAVRASLPAGEQDAAKVALAKVGAEKSAILAPAIRQDPGGWKDWAQKAERETVAALQARVSTALGLKSRGAAPDLPGSRWFTHTLNLIEDPGKRAEVEEAFTLGKQLAKTDNALGVFLRLVEECIQEWRLQVQALEKGAAHGHG